VPQLLPPQLHQHAPVRPLVARQVADRPPRIELDVDAALHRRDAGGARDLALGLREVQLQRGAPVAQCAHGGAGVAGYDAQEDVRVEVGHPAGVRAGLYVCNLLGGRVRVGWGGVRVVRSVVLGDGGIKIPPRIGRTGDGEQLAQRR